MDHDFSKPVTDINTVPAEFRPLYSAEPSGDDNVHALREDAQGVVKAITGLNTALKAARADAKNKKTVDLSPLADFGEDPETILQAVNAKLEEASTAGNKDAKRQLEKLKADMQTQQTKELENRDKRITGLTGQLYNHLVKSAATTAIAAAKGTPDLLLPFVEQQVKVVEADGNFNVVVVDKDGDVRHNVAGSPMSINELVTEMKGNEKYGRLFDSEAPNGGGTPPAGGKPVGGTKQVGDKSSLQKISGALSKMTPAGR